MLVVAAVCPHPPLLVPEVAAGAAAETIELRSAALAAVRVLLETVPDVLVVVGAGSATRAVVAGETGSLSVYGVELAVQLGGEQRGAATLPLSLTVGGWLLREAAYAGPVAGLVVAPEDSAEQCAAHGRTLAGRAARVALLAMGDGSARRSTAAPGYLDDRAAGFDAAAAAALKKADAAALLAIDAELGRDLLAAGRAPWQVLAGAAGADPGQWRSELLYDDAPYGVGYLVATWERA